jgi:hypothetical protein
MTPERLAELSTLIGRMDRAVSPVDGTGKDALRELMPDLRDAINDVNAALREVNALLFEGLRDEAIGLYEDEFPMLAARLNLEDKEAWPEVTRFFAAEGMSPAPKIDFDTLSTLESAYSELELLRRPLTRLRRLVLERATVAQRLAVLRELRKADPTKPVWARSIKDHEEARLVELHTEVRRALGLRDPEAIAALHTELTAPDWGLPIPRELIKATRGADHWASMRSATKRVEEAAHGLEAGWQDVAAGQASRELLERMRLFRSDYTDGMRSLTSSRQALDGCPTVAGLVEEEKLVEQVYAAAARVAPALQWLAVNDAAEAAAARFREICEQLVSLCEQQPRRTTARAWRAEVEQLNAEAESLCASHAWLTFPDSLREQVADALAALHHRSRKRRTLIVSGIVIGVLVGLAIGWLVTASLQQNASLTRIRQIGTRQPPTGGVA